MDKKQSFHSRQGSSKALISEPRKSSDVFLSKPRNARRRENPNLSNSKSDPQRGSKPTKVRPNVDKRPKPRGGNNSLPFNLSASSSGLALAKVEPQEGSDNLEVELNSVYTPGSKKQNLNHLLNFHYSPREYERSTAMNVFGRNGNRAYAKKHKYNKEQFLQANFQFVINSSAESFIDAASPDTLVDWSLIEQINIQTTEEPQCPICLYPPIATKLTRCGHAYCWPCILHYLALTDKSWRKCPICYEAIHLGDLKSTAIVQQINFKVGDIVTLQLMRRRKLSMFVEKTGAYLHDGKIPHVSAAAEQKKFSKFLLANSDEILQIIEREKNELTSNEEPDTPEIVFIYQALDLLQERKAVMIKETCGSEQIEENLTLDISRIDLKEGNPGRENIIDLKEGIPEREKIIELKDGIPENESVINEEEVQANSEHEITIDSEKLPSLTSKEGGKYYYFYQSVDGQNIFLHPLNVKMLQATYGSLEQSPPTIQAKILQKEAQSMDEEHRKKFTCLGHLPLTCQFEIVEVQLEPPIVSAEVLKMFQGDILMRHKTRMRREREEKKREREINAINDRQMGKIISKSAHIDIQSSHQFPICGSEDGLSRSSVGEGSFSYSNDLADSPPVCAHSPQKTNFTSFANVLSSPKKDSWPSLGGANSLPDVPGPSWVKSVNIPARNPMQERNSAVDAEDSEGVPLMKKYLGDVLAEALQQKKKNSVNEKSETGNKKNKKVKKTLLFSTGMNFTGN